MDEPMDAGELARASKASCFKQVVSIQQKSRTGGLAPHGRAHATREGSRHMGGLAPHGRARACREPHNFSNTPRRGNRYTIHCPGITWTSTKNEEVKQHEYDDARKKRLRRVAQARNELLSGGIGRLCRQAGQGRGRAVASRLRLRGRHGDHGGDVRCARRRDHGLFPAFGQWRGNGEFAVNRTALQRALRCDGLSRHKGH